MQILNILSISPIKRDTCGESPFACGDSLIACKNLAQINCIWVSPFAKGFCLHMVINIYHERQQLREAAKTAKMRAGTMGLDEGHAPHLRDVMDILNDVWNEITRLKVKNCWVKTTLISVDKPGTVANMPTRRSN